MARKPSARVVLNRQMLTKLGLAVANGVEEVARTVVETADPPDAAPFGAGLVTRGGWLVYVGNKKVAGGGTDGRQPKKPREWRPATGAVSGVAGFGFPAMFQEFGTAFHGAQPFLTPAVDRVRPHAGQIMASIVGPELDRLR
jgi:hypothetical protein